MAMFTGGMAASVRSSPPPKWFKAAGYLYTSYFPFWWDDNWLIQLWAMASDGPQLFIEGRLEDKPLATLRMRDLRFWTEFYGHMS